MKKLLVAIIIFLVLLILLLAGTGFYFYFKFKPFLFDQSETNGQPVQNQVGDTLETNQVGDKNPLLNEQQEKTLEQIGVDPAKLPTQITPQLEACFTAKLGADRVEAIKKGEQPTTFDFLKAQSCLSN